MEIDGGRVLDALPVMAWTALPDGSIDFVNRPWSDYTGLSLVKGHGVDWQAAVNPDDLAEFLEHWQSVLTSGRRDEMEARIRRFDGQYRWHRFRYSAMRDDTGRIAKWYGICTDVDELRRAKDALHRRELDFQSIVDSIPVPVAVTTPTGEVEGLNQLTLDYFGRTFDELKGWKASDVVHPDDLERTIAAQLEAHQKGSTYTVESRHRRSDGFYRWYRVHGLPLRDTTGQILRWLHLLLDIDDHKRAENALRESESKARAVIDNIPGFVAILTADGKTDVVNLQMAEYHGLTHEELRKWATNKTIHDDDLPGVTEIFHRAIAAGTPYEIEYRLRRFDGVYRWFYSRGVPLRDAAGNITCWYALQTDIQDRKEVEGALHESERDARLIVDSIPAGVGVLTRTGEVEAVNKHMAEYFGKSEEELKNWTNVDIVHPDDDLGSVVDTRLHALATGKPFAIEQRLRGADGCYRWFRVRGSPRYDGAGNLQRWYLVYTDIDDMKCAQEALAASERNLQVTIDTIPVRVGIYSTDGTRVSVNKRAAELSGLPSGTDWRLVFHPEDRLLTESRWRECLASEEPFECEYRSIMADGTYRWHIGRRVPMRDEHGKVIRWYGVSHDIEDRKRAEEALEASERNLKLITDTIPAMAWSACPDGTADFFNKHYLDYVRLPAEEARGWGWTVAVHPEDLDRLAVAWRSILASGSLGEAEARLRRYDGEYRWFLFRANPLRDEKGDIVKWYGINTDIEDRKRSEEGFRAIVETTPECVKVVSGDGKVLRTNAAGAVMAGVQSADEVIGQTFFDFVVPEHRTRYREFHEKVCAGERGFLEFDLVNAKGVRRHMETHAAPMRDSSGSVAQLGVTRDITARKQMEEKLRRSEAFLAEGQYLARMGNLSWRVASGEIIWSEQLYRIFEFDPDTAVTLDRIASRVHPEDMHLMVDMVQQAQNGKNDFEYQHRIILPDQSIKHLHLIAHRAEDRADEIEYIGAVLDVTQRRLSEEALEKLRSELAQVTRIMSLGALTASIAHEVNQPLAGIITNAGTCLRMLAADPPNIDGARETARRTIRDGNRAADVIARLRALFSKKAVTVEPVNLNEAVCEVIALSWGDLQRRRVVPLSELADGLPPVCGDRVQLQQVIMNLLRNAADALSDVEDRPRRLLIRTMREQGNQVRLSVRDTGVGFGPQGTEKLFDAFYTTKSDGMGIGLSVSRSIIENHNGRLWAETNDDCGVTFSFTIPEYSRDELPARTPAPVHAPVIGGTQNAVGNS